MNPNDPPNNPPPQVPAPNVPAPSIPAPKVNVQSLTPTGITGTVPPVARPASGSVPVPVVPVPSAPMPAVYAAVPVARAIEVGLPEAPMPIAPAPKRNPFMAYWRKVGGGSLMLSLAIHGGLIALFVVIVIQTAGREAKVDFLPGGGSKQGQEASQELAHQVQQKKRTQMNKTTPMRRINTNSTNAAISLPDVPIDAVDVPDMAIPMGGMSGSAGFGSTGAGGGFGSGKGMGGQQGFTSLPASMKSRCNAVERLQKLKESGGTPECEKAVSNALEYFKTNQYPDGSWGSGYKGAMTGFALLAYLGRCETPDSTFYGDNVMKGILYLIELSKKNPEGIMAQVMKGNSTPYEHGIATYALGEMYSLARLGGKSLPGMREAFEQGVKTIIKHQHKNGSWTYDTVNGTYADTEGEDLSVAGWQYQALKAAKLSGLKIDNLHTAIDKCVKYLEAKQTKDGGIGGANRESGYNQWNLTGVGVLGLQTLGHGKSSSIKKGIKFAFDFHQKEPPLWTEGRLYDWYYYAQIYFQNGGGEQKYWNETALPEILKSQQKDGSWRKGGPGGDSIYDTALCTLMLEVYYRYLKVGDREEGSIFERK